MSGLISGKVLRSTGSWYTIESETGKLIDCKLKGKFRIEGIRMTNPVAVGDNVDIELQPDSASGVIVHIHERKNYIIRKATKLSSASHIIAANIDQVIVVASIVRPRTSTGFIDRVLTTAEAYHIPSVIVFNKYDLYVPEEIQLLNYYDDTYTKVGYQFLITSVPQDKNFEVFKALLKDKCSLITGHSGVGKSAMINAVDPNLNLKVGSISNYHEKGKHTTTFAEMIRLGFGGYIVDTPGIKEFGLVEFDKTELGQRFPEFRKRMHDCKFNDCMHIDEPGCAILDDLEKGKISLFRYENYLNMMSSI